MFFCVFAVISDRYSFYTFCLMHSLKRVFEQTEIKLVLNKKMFFWTFSDKGIYTEREFLIYGSKIIF